MPKAAPNSRQAISMSEHQQPKEPMYLISESELQSALIAIAEDDEDKRAIAWFERIRSRPHSAPAQCPYSSDDDMCLECKVHEERIASKAREDVLNEMASKVEREEMFLGMTIDNQEVYCLTGQHVRKIIESLRSTQQQAGDERK